MGNTCYMNSVVQALSNTKFLTSYILTNNYRHDINRDNPLGYGGEIVSEFASLTTALWTGTYREVSPADFKRMIDGKNEMFRGSEQHDSQEFLLFLLDGLHEDLNRGTKHVKLVSPPNDEQQTDSERAEVSWKTHVAVNDSVIVRIFQVGNNFHVPTIIICDNIHRVNIDQRSRVITVKCHRSHSMLSCILVFRWCQITIDARLK